MARSFCIGGVALLVGFLIVTQARSVPIDNELKRLQGSWRVSEMIENGRSLSEAEMAQGLPGGGSLEIVDYTVLFKSPVDGVLSTRGFRLDPTSYPKQIVVMDGDRVTGVGIYQLDKGKLIICVAGPSMPAPTEFAAPESSGRTMMVLVSHQPAAGGLPKPPAPTPPRTTQFTSRTTVPTPVANATPPASVPSPAAGRVLSDADVSRVLVGTWQLNDGEGLVDIVFNANQTFTTFRHTETMSNFHSVFVPRPVSMGNWSVQNGQLSLTITSSWRADRRNTTSLFAVRSISTGDAIIVDALGRVVRAVKRQ